MKSRGRKSAASLGVVPVSIEARRPPPPDNLSEGAAQVWRDTVVSMPGGWFDRVHEPLLVAYCRHVVTAERLTQLAESHLLKQSEISLEDMDRLLRMRERESRAVVMCARTMRLTQQAQMHPRTAGRAVERSGGSGRKPWERPP
jgi:hypothetical protein